MPVLSASGYPVPVAPTVSPLETAPPSYQNLTAPLLSETGEALSRFGAQLDKAATSIDNINAFHDQVVSDQNRNAFDKFTNNILYGDPNKPGDTGYLGLQGQFALDKREEVRKTIDDKLLEIRRGLQNQRQLHTFDQETSRYRNLALAQIGRHYNEQYAKNAIQVGKASTELAVQKATQASNTNRWSDFKLHLFEGMENKEKELRTAGVTDAPTIEVERNKVRHKLTQQWAEDAVVRNPLEAKEFIEQNKEYLGDKHAEFAARANTAALKYEAAQVIAGEKAGGPSNLIGAGPAPKSTQPKDIVGHFESDRAAAQKSISPYVIGTGGADLTNAPRDPIDGFPQWGGIMTDKGPSHAAGRYQFQPGTWARYARPLGIKDFSPESQDRVFEAAHAVEGYGAWKPHNSALRDYLDKGSGATAPEGTATTAIPAPVVTPSGMVVVRDKAGVPLPLLPDTSMGFLPDGEVPNLPQALQRAALNLPPNPSPQLWEEVVRQLRVRHNSAHSSITQAEQIRRIAERKQDDAVKKEYHTRMGPGIPNMPSVEDILKDSRLSADAQEGLSRFRMSFDKQDPRAAENDMTLLDIHRRVLLPDGHPNKITGQKQIEDLRSDMKLTYQGFSQGLALLARVQDAKKAQIDKQVQKLVSSAEKVIFPTKDLPGGYGVTQDPTGPMRVKAYWDFIEQQINEYEKTGNPNDLLTAPQPGQKNPKYLGNPEHINKYTRKAWEEADPEATAKAAIAVIPKEVLDMPLNTLAQTQAAWKAGRFGAYGSKEAHQKVIEYARSKGWLQPPSTGPAPGEAPLR